MTGHGTRDSVAETVLWRIIRWVYAPLAAALVLAAFLTKWLDLRFADLTRDTAAVGNLPGYTGFFSNLGAVIWAAAMSISLFTACLLQGRSLRSQRIFFLVSGLLSALLLADDLLMIHDWWVPHFLHHGGTIFCFGHAVLMVWYLIAFRRAHLAGDWPLLLSALALLAFSLFTDFVSDRTHWHTVLEFLLEDGAKLLGIAGWASYLLLTCHRALTPLPGTLARPDQRS